MFVQRLDSQSIINASERTVTGEVTVASLHILRYALVRQDILLYKNEKGSSQGGPGIVSLPTQNMLTEEQCCLIKLDENSSTCQAQRFLKLLPLGQSSSRLVERKHESKPASPCWTTFGEGQGVAPGSLQMVSLF